MTSLRISKNTRPSYAAKRSLSSIKDDVLSMLHQLMHDKKKYLLTLILVFSLAGFLGGLMIVRIIAWIP